MLCQIWILPYVVVTFDEFWWLSSQYNRSIIDASFGAFQHRTMYLRIICRTSLIAKHIFVRLNIINFNTAVFSRIQTFSTFSKSTVWIIIFSIWLILMSLTVTFWNYLCYSLAFASTFAFLELYSAFEFSYFIVDIKVLDLLLDLLFSKSRLCRLPQELSTSIFAIFRRW